MSDSEHCLISIHVPLSPDRLKEAAIEELGESEELKEKCLHELRDLIKEHKLSYIPTDDFLLRFLRHKKFQTQKSSEVFRNFSRQRPLLQKRFLELRPEIVEACCRLSIFGFLPYRDPQGRRIYFVRPGFWNPQVCSSEEWLTTYFLHALHAADDESGQITGIITIYDMKSVSASLFLHLIPLLNRWRNFIFNCLPVRYPKTHVLNTYTCIKHLRFIIFPLVPKKVANRTEFHNKPGEAFFEKIPASILPDVFGGTLGPLETDAITQTMMDYLQNVKDEHQHFQLDC